MVENMNERIRELARQSGATDENGSRATTVYCFTDQELNGFAELLIQECATYVKNSNCFTYASQADLCAERMNKHFGIDHEN